MNEKGFAATGILYTILVVFILIMFSMLSLLYSRNNLLNKIQAEVEKSLSGLILKNVSPTTSTIQIEYVKNNVSGEVREITCKSGLTRDNYTTVTNGTETSCTLENLTSNTQYYYEVCVVYNTGSSNCQSGQAKTNIDIFNYNVRDDTLIGNIYSAGFTKGVSEQSDELIIQNINIYDAGYLHLPSSFAGVSTYSYSSNMIDVTNLKQLRYTVLLGRNCEDYEFSSDFYFGLTGAKDNLDNSFDISSNLHLDKEELSTGTQYVNIDVSNLTGNKYLKFVVHHGEEFDSCTSYGEIYNIEGIY